MNAEKGKSLESLNQTSYTALSAQIDLPSMEHQILEFWRTGEIFAKSTAISGVGWSSSCSKSNGGRSDCA